MYANVIYAVALMSLVEVKSNDLILGKISTKSRLLYSDIQEARMAPWVRKRHLTIQGHPGDLISAIRVLDLKRKKDGIARLDGGEIGAPKVVLSLRSGGPFKSYAFKVDIFVERPYWMADIQNNTVLKDFVRNISKSVVQETLREMVKNDETEDDVPESITYRVIIKPELKKKRKRKKGKNKKWKTKNQKDTLKNGVFPLNKNVAPISISSKQRIGKIGMKGTESKTDRLREIPPMSGVYSRWTQLSLPSVRISTDLIVTDAPTSLPVLADVNFENLL